MCQVMKGYLGRPEATAETIRADGFLRSGDLAYYDAQGEIFLVDRLKELIKVKGFQVANGIPIRSVSDPYQIRIRPVSDPYKIAHHGQGPPGGQCDPSRMPMGSQ